MLVVPSLFVLVVFADNGHIGMSEDGSTLRITSGDAGTSVTIEPSLLIKGVDVGKAIGANDNTGKELKKQLGLSVDAAKVRENALLSKIQTLQTTVDTLTPLIDTVAQLKLDLEALQTEVGTNKAKQAKDALGVAQKSDLEALQTEVGTIKGKQAKDALDIAPAIEAAVSPLAEAIKTTGGKVDAMRADELEAIYGFSSGLKSNLNQQNAAVRGFDASRVRQAVLNGYNAKAQQWHLNNGPFELFTAAGNMIIQVEYFAHYYVGKSFRYERWIVSIGSGGSGGDRCDSASFTKVEGHGGLGGGLHSVFCGGDPARLGGDRSGYRRIMLKQQNNMPGGATSSVKVTVLSTETIDDFWIMAPHSISSLCYATHLQCGVDKGRKSGWQVPDCTLKLRQCLFKWHDCKGDTHDGLESCKNEPAGPYTVHNNRIRG